MPAVGEDVFMSTEPEFTADEAAVLELLTEDAFAFLEVVVELGGRVSDAQRVARSLVERGYANVGRVDERSTPWRRDTLTVAEGLAAIESPDNWSLDAGPIWLSFELIPTESVDEAYARARQRQP